jgi:hypothetical protein
MSFIVDLDFVGKYRPLLQILADVADMEDITAEPGYTRNAGERYKEVRLRALQGYMEELAMDFDHLKTALTGSAVMDAELAEALKQTERNLLRFFRRTRARILVERFFKAPEPSFRPQVGLLRGALVRMLRGSGLLTDILRTMNSFGGMRAT